MTREEAIKIIESVYERQVKDSFRLEIKDPVFIDFDVAFNMAIEALNNQQTQWVPVSERLPEEMGTYMTTVDYGKHGLATGQRYYHGKGLGWEDDCVIAWMPLPKPYMKGGE